MSIRCRTGKQHGRQKQVHVKTTTCQCVIVRKRRRVENGVVPPKKRHRDNTESEQFEVISKRRRVIKNGVVPMRHRANTTSYQDSVVPAQRHGNAFFQKRCRVNTTPCQYDVVSKRRRGKTTRCQHGVVSKRCRVRNDVV